MRQPLRCVSPNSCRRRSKPEWPEEREMDEAQKELVRATFARIAPIADQAAEMFYDRLFAIDPDLPPMFKNDMRKQGAMLMAVLATAVGNLHRLDQILPTVRELGRRHTGYGVRDKDYDK